MLFTKQGYSYCLKTILGTSLVSQFRSVSVIKIKDIERELDTGNPVSVKGWVKALRKMKDLVFLDLDDGSSKMLQVVVEKEKTPFNLSFGSSIEAKGFLQSNKNRQIELLADHTKVIGECDLDANYPFQPKKTYSDEYLRKYLHFRARSTKFSSLLRIRHMLCSAVHNYFSQNGFIHIHTPVLTTNDCEGAGEVFCVVPYDSDVSHSNEKTQTSKNTSFFGNAAYMTVSGQLHLEIMARSMGHVYSFGPTFRAENSKSRLHLSEFYMIEAEMAFVYKLEDIMKFIENFIKSVTETILNECDEDISKFRNLNQQNCEYLECPSDPFTVITYSEAVKIFDQNSHRLQSDFHSDKSLNKEHELFLVKYNGNKPLFIINWPKSFKPFYMKSMPGNEDMVMGFDLLTPNVGELCGGSLREDDFNKLHDSLFKHNLEDKLQWYLELRKFGNAPTGGFGLGFERYIQALLGVSNIKDTIPFPRWPHNCKL